MNTTIRSAALRAIAAVAHIDLKKAVGTRRHNPILDSEINIEEELINLKESCDTLHLAQDSLQRYPKMYAHIHQERRDIMQHCLGLVVRMMYGNRPSHGGNRKDIDTALKRLVGLVLRERRRAGKRLDGDILQAFRPYLTVRERVQLRDFGLDLVAQAAQLQRAVNLAQKLQLPLLRAK